VIEGDGIRIRRATPTDVDFMLEIVTHEDVQPFLGARAAFSRERLQEELERQKREPEAYGRFVIEVVADGEWRRAGTLGFECASEHNRIAHLERLAVHPEFRGRRLADAAARLFQRYLIFELGFHRLQLEIYGFNERAQRHAERAGWIREGAKRKAYWRHGEWTDGIMYGLIREDLED
jgi:RimJ/RimL family protein N-acetyltransferase